MVETWILLLAAFESQLPMAGGTDRGFAIAAFIHCGELSSTYQLLIIATHSVSQRSARMGEGVGC